MDPRAKSYKNVKLVNIDCRRSRSLEAISHTLKGIFTARRLKPDILHIHAVGPSLLIPLARFLGMRTVMTNHGPDYRRKKWGFLAKQALKFGERMGSSFADEVICISQGLADEIRGRYNRESCVIPNGVEIQEPLQSTDALDRFSLTRNKYILTVGRFVPEKGFDYLIEAFGKARLKGWKLVIVGAADHHDRFSQMIKEKVQDNKNIKLTGFLHGKLLEELYSHAGLFVLPSYYEGLPIVLFEAISYGLTCLASNITANHSAQLPDKNYFTAGNSAELTGKLKEFIENPLPAAGNSGQIEMLKRHYDWDKIAGKTMDVYKKVVLSQDEKRKSKFLEIADKLSSKNRSKKYSFFMDYFKPTAETKVLDVGASEREYQKSANIIEKRYPYPEKLTVLGVDNFKEFPKTYPRIKRIVTYKGQDFPFKDKEFDVCWCNAVIEHVGNRNMQKKFLKEIHRISKAAFITTPNRFFPFETHTKIFLLHYLPNKIFDNLLIRLNKGWAAGHYMQLLSLRDIRALLKECNIGNFTIVKNRIFGFVVDFVIIFRD